MRHGVRLVEQEPTMVGEGTSAPGPGPNGPQADLEGRVMAALHRIPRAGLVEWYASLAPSWLEAEPAMRRLLMRRIHLWIAERVLTPARQDMPPASADLKPGGALVRSLFDLVPPGQLAEWRGWVRLVVVDLKRTLQWPAVKRNDAWVHWLFLIPYAEQGSPVAATRAEPPAPDE